MADGMSDRQLLAIIAQHEQAAMGGTSAATNLATAGTTTNYGTLDVERAQALDYYHGRPLGNEQADRSQVVSQDVRDIVEWIKPQILRMFTDTDEVVRFDPEGPQDEQQAEQESDVVNYIIMRQNDGVMVLHDALTDALILKNGYVKVWYDTETHEQFENYSGLDEATVAFLIQQIEQDGERAEIVAKREVKGVTQGPDGQPQPTVTYDIRLKRHHKVGRCFVECVATEDMLVSPRTTGSLQDSPFVAQRVRKTRSELKELGYDSSLEAPSNDPRIDIQSIARSDTTDELGGDSAGSDRSMEEIECLECYMRVDYDGDGDAELRKVFRAGNQILANDPISAVPFAYASPIRMPHRHIGISIFDLAKDIQDIKTTLIRQTLDNAYLINNGRTVINGDNVSVEDLLVSRPGGIVRTKGVPGQDVMPLPVQPITQGLLEVSQYVDGITAQRTGISATTQGLDPDTLQGSTANAYNDAMNAATAKIELMARLFAEMVKQVAILVHGCIVRHQDKPMTLKLRSQWVQIDPSSWRNRYAVTVKVGLGTGNRSEMRQNLMLLGQAQQAAAAAGIIQPPNVYALFIELAKALKFQAPERFATDPASPQFQQMQAQKQQQASNDPKVAAAKINAQAGVQKAQVQAQGDLMHLKAEQDMQTQELILKAQIEGQKMAAEAQKAQQSGNVQLAAAYLNAKQKHDAALMDLVNQNQKTEQQREASFLKALQGSAQSAGAQQNG